MPIVVAFTAGVALSIAVMSGTRTSSSRAMPSASLDGSAERSGRPSSIYDLLALSDEQLDAIDVALMNLLCAQGLPGAEDLDISGALNKLDEWAAKVKFETERHLYRLTDPQYAEHYNHSEARLRVEFIVQVLQEDCGVRYNPDRIYTPDFRDARDTFLHGMLPGSSGGTCASMPVMYVAIGRRLGYPMKLVQAKAHLFCRWDDGKERINIEGAGNGGVNYDSDEYYRTWPKPISDAEMASGVYLTTLTPRQELAIFLEIRGGCARANGVLPEARTAFAEAHRLEPRSGNTFAGLLLACGVKSNSVRVLPNLASDIRPGEPLPTGPDDPTPRTTMPGVTPTFGTPNRHQPLPVGGITQEAPR